MPRLTRHAALALGAGVALGLAACAQNTPEASPSPTPTASRTAVAAVTATPTPSPSPSPAASPTPEAAASTAAAPEDNYEQGVQDAVTRYLAEFNRIAQDLSADPVTIADVALDPEKERAYNQLKASHDAGLRQVGDVAIIIDLIVPQEGSITTYMAGACFDTSQADMVDSENRSVWGPDELRRTDTVIYIERRGADYIVADLQHTSNPCQGD
ncbi:MAG: hypothetical protein LBR33_02600 [Propionibacteriaceae bacterium]|jgi:hypothetical protein|nr:hypothetical protein [Propionibacteriaceae bacterium]